MFIGPWEQGGDWNDSGIGGMYRWLNRVWNLLLEPYVTNEKAIAADNSASEKSQRDLQRAVHRTIRKVTQDIERMRFNTMLAFLMEYTNFLAKVKEEGLVTYTDWESAIDTLLLLIAPTTPHLAEELWQRTEHPYSIHNQSWPKWDEELAKEEEITLVIQVNGKLRDRLTVPVTITEEEAKQLALERERVKAYLEGTTLIKIIYVPQRLVNIVLKGK
jgi:leucyl-tRNA synthetase